MEGNVKGRRNYHSPKRQAQAQATRLRLIAAATNLFADHGFVGTTMAAVAAQAGVSTPMVFAVFETKAKLLATAIGVAVRGDDADAPLRESTAWKTMLATEDATQLVRRFAALQRSINARAWSLIDAGRAAAASDRELAQFVAAGARNRWSDCRAVAGVLAERAQLRTGISVDHATDLFWCMCGSELYRMLVVERGWSPKAYERWLSEVLAERILA